MSDDRFAFDIVFTREEIVRFEGLLPRLSVPASFWLVGAATCLICGLIAVVTGMVRPIEGRSIAVIGLMAYLAGYFTCASVIGRRKQRDTLVRAYRVVIETAGIKASREHADVSFRWAGLRRADVYPDVLMIWTDDGRPMMLPYHRLTTSEEGQRLVAFVKDRIAAAAPPR